MTLHGPLRGLHSDAESHCGQTACILALPVMRKPTLPIGSRHHPVLTVTVTSEGNIMLTRYLTSLVVLFSVAATPAFAALKPGDKAPMFKARASLGGKEFTFSLSEALKKGPVVVYFYPQAFTSGCTIEAHEFAEAMAKFNALGATVIGVSNDDIATLDKFSTSECRSKFPVAADKDQRIMTAYDSVMMGFMPYANRTSYVVTPDGLISYEYTALDPSDHVKNTLSAIKSWKAKHG